MNEEKDIQKANDRLWGIPPAAFDLIKWILGTFLLAVAGIAMQLIQMKSDIRIKQLDEDSKLMSTVAGKFETDKDTVDASYHKKELNYLTFIRTFILSSDLQNNVDGRIASLQDQAREVQKALIVSQSNAAAKDTSSFRGAIRMELKKLAASPSADSSPKPMTAYYQQEAKVLAADSLKGKASRPVVSKDVQSLNLPVTPIKVADDFVLAGAPVTQWCKAGYYIEFNSTLWVGVGAVDGVGQTAIVNLKDIETLGSKPTDIKTNVSLSANSPLVFDYTNPDSKNTYRYQVTLNYIGSGGKNPFTKAAYITVAVYKKSK